MNTTTTTTVSSTGTTGTIIASMPDSSFTIHHS
jgi:hypothetical protein